MRLEGHLTALSFPSQPEGPEASTQIIASAPRSANTHERFARLRARACARVCSDLPHVCTDLPHGRAGLTPGELHVPVLMSFIKLIKLLQNLMKLLPNHIMV